MPNERVAFASFMNPRMPAITRWREREAEVFTSSLQLDYVSPLPEVANLCRSARSALPSAAVASFGNLPKPPNVHEFFTVWRLISGNHRELARGVGLFAGYAPAAVHAQSVLDAAPALTVTLAQHPGTGGFGWYASLGSHPVMVTPAWQRSARDRDRSVLTAVRALAGARILATTAQHGHRHLSEAPLVDSPGGHLP